jgi:cell wall-associated NlpC family hydrolase
MRRGAKPCAPTSADRAATSVPGPASRGFFSLSVPAVLLVAAVGCGPSSPRFSDGARTASKTPVAREGPRFATREAEEERREDNKPVPKAEIERVTSGARSFRTEKNTAIAPLDHSRMMREISKHMGVPYRLGGESDQGMDCSGYTMVVYEKSLGKKLPRTSAEQSKMGRSVEPADLKFGDLVFFNTTGEPASHVGIYLGDDLFAHASVSLGVTISSLESAYYQKRYEGARRIVD